MLDIIGKWKIWGIIISVLGVVLTGLKVRGDHYKRKAENKEAELEVEKQNSEVKEFQAINIERKKVVENEIKNIDSDIKPDSTYSL